MGQMYLPGGNRIDFMEGLGQDGDSRIGALVRDGKGDVTKRGMGRNGWNWEALEG